MRREEILIDPVSTPLIALFSAAMTSCALCFRGMVLQSDGRTTMSACRPGAPPSPKDVSPKIIL
jgi:hypothetical protein